MDRKAAKDIRSEFDREGSLACERSYISIHWVVPKDCVIGTHVRMFDIPIRWKDRYTTFHLSLHRADSCQR
jgi:hypothetical protein